MKTFAAILVFTLTLPAIGATHDESKSTKAVIELFTSQGCYSCPPADELLGATPKSNKNIIGFEFHVDYWDQLVHGADGSWQDPFSNPQHTARQRLYNTLPLQGRRGVYTPQMIVNGNFALVGSNSQQLRHQLEKQTKIPTQIYVLSAKNNNLAVKINGEPNVRANIWLINFIPEITTEIKSGENKGASMRNVNVVTAMQRVGLWNGGVEEFNWDISDLPPEQRCAILVQKPMGEILGASYCP